MKFLFSIVVLAASYAGFRFYEKKKIFKIIRDIEQVKAITNFEYKGDELRKIKLQEQVEKILLNHNMTISKMNKNIDSIVSNDEVWKFF